MTAAIRFAEQETQTTPRLAEGPRADSSAQTADTSQDTEPLEPQSSGSASVKEEVPAPSSAGMHNFKLTIAEQTFEFTVLLGAPISDADIKFCEATDNAVKVEVIDDDDDEEIR